MPRKKGKSEVTISPFAVFLYMCLIGFILMIIIGFSMLSRTTYEDIDPSMPNFKDPHADEQKAVNEQIRSPIVLWWAPIGADSGNYRKCGKKECFFTSDKHYYSHYQTKVLMFYGSNMKLKEAPVPRKPNHEWALLHEESPKNNFALCTPELLELFNHTSTFRRESDFPLTTQYIEGLDWLTSTKYLVPTAEKTSLNKELAPVVYVQSDCNPPSDRDSLVQLLMKKINVDSYGSCLHNKDLPDHLKDPIPGMDHDDFFKLQAQYKFTIAMENAVCDDYITEKIWRPLMLGSVPVIRGSSKIRDLLPDKQSAIIIDDFRNIDELAAHLKFLSENDEEYDKYLQWKKTGITNNYLKQLIANRTWHISDTWMDGRSNFIEDYECFVCKRIHENMERRSRGEKELRYQANEQHMGCPKPMQYNSQGVFESENYNWIGEYDYKLYEAKALRYFIDKNYPMDKGDFHAKVSQIRYENKKGWLG